MARSQETFNKKENEKKKQKKKKDKEQRREERKANSGKKSFEDMIAYVDEYGNITSTPPDPLKKKEEINQEDIQISISRKEEAEPADTVRKGTVVFFNLSKGYGFIKDQQSQESIFVHQNGLIDPIRENDRVTFETRIGPKGPSAVQVKLVK